MIKSISLKLLVAIVSIAFSLCVLGAENFPANYNENADIAELARLENDSMHYQLIQSKVTDKPALWRPFTEQLAALTAADYEALKPLVLEKSIVDLQAAVRAGQLTYSQLTAFYIYRIREIESDSGRFLNAVIALNPEAMNRARELDAQRAKLFHLTLYSEYRCYSKTISASKACRLPQARSP